LRSEKSGGQQQYTEDSESRLQEEIDSLYYGPSGYTGSECTSMYQPPSQMSNKTVISKLER
jgi:hypothetical protein